MIRMKQSELIGIIKEVVNEESLKMEEGAGSKSLDILQLALDVAGIPPAIGTAVNGANTAISLLRAAYDKETDERKKHLIDAGLNAVSMVPFASVVKLVKLRALRKPAVMAARFLKGGVRTTPRSYEPLSAMEEGAGWGTTTDIKKDPKHIDDPKNGKMERWRIKYASSRDLSKHGNTEKSPVNEKISKKELREMIKEILNEKAGPGQEDWVKSNKDRFKKQYGKDWAKFLYGHSWNQAKSQGKTQQDEISLTPNAHIPVGMQPKHYVSKPVKISATGEWVVKWMTNGKRDENKTYYTDDQKDANDTYGQMVKNAQLMNASGK